MDTQAEALECRISPPGAVSCQGVDGASEWRHSQTEVRATQGPVKSKMASQLPHCGCTLSTVSPLSLTVSFFPTRRCSFLSSSPAPFKSPLSISAACVYPILLILSRAVVLMAVVLMVVRRRGNLRGHTKGGGASVRTH